MAGKHCGAGYGYRDRCDQILKFYQIKSIISAKAETCWNVCRSLLFCCHVSRGRLKFIFGDGTAEQRLQKKFYLWEFGILMLVKHIGISEERRTIFHIKFFDIAIKIIQTDAWQDWNY